MDRLVQPEIKPLDSCNLAEPDIFYLKNGVRVVQFNAGTQELVRIELIFKAGSWYQSKNFVSMAANLMLREGTSKYNSQQIADTLDYYGAHLECSAERDNAYISLYTLNKHIEHTLPVLEEIVKHASFPEDEYRIFSGKQKQMLRVNLEKVNFVARTQFNSLIYGPSHAYGNYMLMEDIDKVTISDLKEFHANYYHAGNCTILVAGKIEKHLADSLEESFGGNDWIRPELNGQNYSITPSAEKIKYIRREGSLQSAVRMGRVLFNRHHQDYIGMRVLNTMLGGYFGSRLMTNLREDKGYTYGIGSAMVPLQHSGYFFITCEVGAEVTGQALKEIRKELDLLRSEEVKEEELSLVKNYMLGSFLRGIDGPFALADTYRDIMEQDLDNSFQYKFLNTVKTITPAKLKKLAVEYLDPADMHLLIVGRNEAG